MVYVAEILGPDMLIVLGIIALIFGAAKLPQLARSLGQAKSEFEKGQRGEVDEPAETGGAAALVEKTGDATTTSPEQKSSSDAVAADEAKATADAKAAPDTTG